MHATRMKARTVQTRSSATQRSPDEGELVRRAQRGEEQAREELARRYRDRAYITALQILGRPEDAKDVAQEALLSLFVHLDRLDPKRPVAPWLQRIVRNQAIDHLRRRRVRRAQSLDTSGPEGSAIDVIDDEIDIAGDAELRQRQHVIWGCLRSLSDEHREIVVLRDYQDLSYQEVAQTLGVPVGTVMSRLHRARKALREGVREELGEWWLGDPEDNAG